MAKYKRLCPKCKKYFLPNEMTKLGYCKECSINPNKCKMINELGYQCQNKKELFGYCLYHFLTLPLSKLKEEAKRL